jgi:hypothetical protein
VTSSGEGAVPLWLQSDAATKIAQLTTEGITSGLTGPIVPIASSALSQ